MKILVLLASLMIAPSVFAEAKFKSLNAKDPVAKTVEHFNTEWNDGNITSGTSQIRAAQVSQALLQDRKNLEKILITEMQNNIEPDNDDISLSIAKTKSRTALSKSLDSGLL